MEHHLFRDEWVKRFRAHIVKRADLKDDDPFATEIVESELDSWPEKDYHMVSDWTNTLPEDAADEQMENWGD